ncbi:hypothetical protein AK830_g3928 [Neonectria ditissima]|uniref:Uncharacterized protein n=1 Tax=Neonectria ditissima TaxID=78410 RepID=A0A0P7BAA9_9HYPO|nr:hypothetical protein AK830_g3928 [Neonectria ditissima]
MVSSRWPITTRTLSYLRFSPCMSAAHALSILGLPSSPRQPSIGPLNPPQPPLQHRRLFLDSVQLQLYHARRTQRRLRDLPGRSGSLLLVVAKQRLHPYASVHSPAPAQQTAVARAMPEAPPEADTLIPAEDELPAHLTDREVEKRGVAWRASEAGGPADNVRWAVGEVEAECAGEDIGRARRGHCLEAGEGLRVFRLTSS